jgi:hypothetical protein
MNKFRELLRKHPQVIRLAKEAEDASDLEMAVLGPTLGHPYRKWGVWLHIPGEGDRKVSQHPTEAEAEQAMRCYQTELLCLARG